MTVVACPSCGETYVSSAQTCADCGVPLVDPSDSPAATRLEPGNEDEVGYDLDDWEPEQRGELVTQLTARGIPHRWEEGELIVRERDADWVEPVIDDIDHPDALEVEEDDDDDAAAEVLSSLYVAADVLAGDPVSPGAIVELCDAEGEAKDLDAPYGVAAAVWEEILTRTTALAELLDAGADPDEVRVAARSLRDLVRPLV
jgi:hypothetical protein